MGRFKIVTCAALLALGFLWSCSVNVATGPTTATGGSGGAVNGGGNPSATPSPGAGGELPAGSFVRLGLFGQSCPQGTTAPPNGLRQILLPCTGFMTATTKDSAGNDIPAAVHGPNITWSITFGQNVVNLITPPEPFNRDARCNTAGGFGLSAQVKNISGTAEFECVARASGSATGAVWSLGESRGTRVYFWNEQLATEELKAEAIARDQAYHRLER